MDEHKESYTIEELEKLTGVSVRNIRYYVTEGLLGKGTPHGQRRLFGEEHRLRLELILRLKERHHLPIDEIRRRLHGLSPADVRGLLAEEERQSTELQRADQRSPRDFLATLLQQERAKRGLQEEAEPQLSEEQRQDTELQRADQRSPRDYLATLRQQEQAKRGLPAEPESQPWQRWVLAPGIELHVRTDQLEAKRRLIKRLCDLARRKDTAEER